MMVSPFSVRGYFMVSTGNQQAKMTRAHKTMCFASKQKRTRDVRGACRERCARCDGCGCAVSAAVPVVSVAGNVAG